MPVTCSLAPYLAPWLFVTIVLIVTPQLEAQGTWADYHRMHQLDHRFANKVFRDRLSPHWLEGGEHFWYRKPISKTGHTFVLVDLIKQTRLPAFDHAMIARQLAQQSGQPVTAEQLPLQSLVFSPDRKNIFFDFHQTHWKIDRAENRLEAMPPSQRLQSIHHLPLHPSLAGGRNVRVTFVNDSPTPLQVIWIDPHGKPHPYATLGPGNRMQQETFVDHVWLFQNEGGKTVGVMEVRDNNETFHIDGRIQWQVTPVAQPNLPASPPSHATSPDKKWKATVQAGKLVIKATGTESVVFSPRSPNHYFSQKFYWSPNSRYLLAVEIQPAPQREIPLIESSPADQLQPKLILHPYAKPGDPIDHPHPRLFDLKREKEIAFDTSMLPNPWSIGEYRWRDDSSEVCFLYNRRGHQELCVMGVDPRSGSIRTIIRETSPTFIDYRHKHFAYFLEPTNEIIWMSERDGWNHLYLIDWKTGKVKNQITQGHWVVRSVDHVDPATRQIWFTAGGVVKGEDPYYLHAFRIDFDGQHLVRLTDGNGTHQVTYSPNRKYLIDSCSRVDMAPVTTVRRTSDGHLVCPLEKADIRSLKSAGWQAPEPFVAKGRDGKTDIYGVIYRPTNFDPSKKYPVIEFIYAGPQSAFVPKQFSTLHPPMRMAELGFIVVQIDGMGTSHRSKAFHDVCWKNLGDSGFPDRIRWLQAAARNYPSMDLDHVGIYGGSAGGQSALRALLAHGDFYHVAVADSGCHDNRIDKIWWNELWMGWPVGPHYAEQSNVTQAHRLRGKLLLIVGELDRNVDPASTMQVVNALIKADKDFDLLVIPGEGHMAGTSPYGMRRTRDFFVRHLTGKEPRRRK